MLTTICALPFMAPDTNELYFTGMRPTKQKAMENAGKFIDDWTDLESTHLLQC